MSFLFSVGVSHVVRSGSLVRSPLGWVCSLLCLAALSGCGAADGPNRYAISGSVFFKDAPVPRGQISFEPDAEAGAKSPGCTGQIIDGEFKIPAASGHTGGKLVVVITGFDGVSTDPTLPEGKSLFPIYRSKIELTAEDTLQDFIVETGDTGKKPAKP